MATRIDETTKELPVQLSDAEVRERGLGLAETQAKLEKQIDHEKEIKRDLKSAREKIEHEIADLARIVRNGREPRPVQCEVIADFNKGTAREVRLDTGECVLERMLTEAEIGKQQREMF